jgi:xylose isomerase
MMHELRVAADAGALGSIDANSGDPMLGWDTDQFPTDLYLTTRCMLVILEMGGLTTGGVNFDAKVRRESFEPVDLFYAHIGGMDAFARGLKTAHAILSDGRLKAFVEERYRSWDGDLGRQIESGRAGFADLEAYIMPRGEAAPNRSGRQELLENMINDFI